jgi:hypothetical protein
MLPALNSLEDVKNRLDAAMGRMRSIVGAGRPEQFAAALRETRSLSMECRALRDEVERHKAEHGELQRED